MPPTAKPAADTGDDTGRCEPRGRRTRTRTFGTGERVGHDAGNFYRRFDPPAVTDSDNANPTGSLRRPVRAASSEQMDLPDHCVALVVTSPPYHVGKTYDTDSSYPDHLGLLHRVLGECHRVLEDGGRIAVNVANLGRKPYRNLASDVTVMLEDLGYLLRGEIIWRKAAGAGNSCAWGTYRDAANPVLRDTTERVIVASKGQFHRAGRTRRERGELPHRSTITPDEFLRDTLDVWDIPAESATRVGHPAPYPVELPERLIRLYTYEGDTVLDPFAGSGTTLVAARRNRRHYVGYELDAEHARLALRRIHREGRPLPDLPAHLEGRTLRRAAEEALHRLGWHTSTGRIADLTLEPAATPGGTPGHALLLGRLTRSPEPAGGAETATLIRRAVDLRRRWPTGPVLVVTAGPVERAARAALAQLAVTVLDVRDPGTTRPAA